MSTHTLDRVSERRRWPRPIAERKVSGFNLFELLIVLCVAGALAAVTLFSLNGVAGAGSTAACNSDSKVINQAAQSLIIENPVDLPTTPQAWRLALLGETQSGVWGSIVNGAPFLSGWPQSSGYTFSVAGTSAASTTGDVPPVNPANGDVIVSVNLPRSGTRTYDSTVSPLAACGSL